MALALLLIVIPAGCAHRPPRSTATPVRRVLVDTMRVAPAPSPAPAPSSSSLRTLAAHDTAYVASVLRRCGDRALLPDQESTRDALRAMLVEARAALQRDDLEQARSLARNARQLATSLRCP